MKEEFDKCIMCGKETQFKNTDHISIRKHYVEGAGQLCDLCYFKIYGINLKYYNQGE